MLTHVGTKTAAIKTLVGRSSIPGGEMKVLTAILEVVLIGAGVAVWIRMLMLVSR